MTNELPAPPTLPHSSKVLPSRLFSAAKKSLLFSDAVDQLSTQASPSMAALNEINSTGSADTTVMEMVVDWPSGFVMVMVYVPADAADVLMLRLTWVGSTKETEFIVIPPVVEAVIGLAKPGPPAAGPGPKNLVCV